MVKSFKLGCWNFGIGINWELAGKCRFLFIPGYSIYGYKTFYFAFHSKLFSIALGYRDLNNKLVNHFNKFFDV